MTTSATASTPSHPTLPTLLKTNGYATGAAVSAYVLRGDERPRRGVRPVRRQIVAPAGSDALGARAAPGRRDGGDRPRWLEGAKDSPFFLFFHVYEPHAALRAAGAVQEPLPAAYDGEIAAADAIVGGLLDALRRTGVYDRAVVVIVLSDHGEGLGEHGEDDHGILLYRWALHVPLLVKLPGRLAARRTRSRPRWS